MSVLEQLVREIAALQEDRNQWADGAAKFYQERDRWRRTAHGQDKPPRVMVALTGRKGCGKDTAARVLIEEHGFTRVALADGVRDVALAIDPYVEILGGDPVRLRELGELAPSRVVGSVEWWDAAKQAPEVRRLLQRIGTEGVRDVVGLDSWTRVADRKISHLDGPVVVTDVRFHSEVTWARSVYGACVLRIDRPGADNNDQHSSERDIESLWVDGVVINNGTVADLHQSLMQCIQERWPTW